MPKLFKKYLPEILAVLIMTASLIPLSLNRLIARDEGFYTYTAKLLNQGKALYSDFFFPQMPLTAHVYAVWAKVFGETWESFRLLNALLAIILGIILINYIKKSSGHFLSIIGIFLYTFSNYIFPWYLAALTYSLSVLLLFVSYLQFQKNNTCGIFLAGIFFCLAFQCRLFFIALGPAFVFYLYWQNKSDFKSFLKLFGIFTAGFLITLLPIYYYMLKDLAAFYFDNYAHHLFRANESERMLEINKSNIIKVMLGFRNTAKYEAFQIPLLIYGSIITAGILFFRYKKLCLAFLIAASLFVINLLPEPTHVQYYAALIPFLLITCLTHINWQALPLNSANKYKLSPRNLKIAIVGLTVFYLFGINTDIENYTSKGFGVIGIMNPEEASHWNLDRTKEVSAILNKHSQPGDSIITSWPGYLLETHLQAYPGTENHFGIQAADKVNVAEAARYKIISPETINQIISEGKTKFVMLTRIDKRKKKTEETLLNSGYKLIEQNDTFRLFKKQ